MCLRAVRLTVFTSTLILTDTLIWTGNRAFYRHFVWVPGLLGWLRDLCLRLLVRLSISLLVCVCPSLGPPIDTSPPRGSSGTFLPILFHFPSALLTFVCNWGNLRQSNHLIHPVCVSLTSSLSVQPYDRLIRTQGVVLCPRISHRLLNRAPWTRSSPPFLVFVGTREEMQLWLLLSSLPSPNQRREAAEGEEGLFWVTKWTTHERLWSPLTRSVWKKRKDWWNKMHRQNLTDSDKWRAISDKM